MKWIGFYQICPPSRCFQDLMDLRLFIQIHDPPLVALACPTSLPDPACSGQYGPPQTPCEWVTAVLMFRHLFDQWLSFFWSHCTRWYNVAPFCAWWLVHRCKAIVGARRTNWQHPRPTKSRPGVEGTSGTSPELLIRTNKCFVFI